MIMASSWMTSARNINFNLVTMIRLGYDDNINVDWRREATPQREMGRMIGRAGVVVGVAAALGYPKRDTGKIDRHTHTYIHVDKPKATVLSMHYD